MKKALHDLITGDKNFEEGKLYTDEQVAGLDLSHFIDVDDVNEVKVDEEIKITEPEMDSIK